MAKGGWTTDTRVISVRVPATVYSIIERRANRRNMTVGDWVKRVIIYDQHIPAGNGGPDELMLVKLDT